MSYKLPWIFGEDRSLLRLCWALLVVWVVASLCSCTVAHAPGLTVVSVGKATVRHCKQEAQEAAEPSLEQGMGGELSEGGEECVTVETASVSQQAAEPIAELIRAIGAAVRALLPGVAS